MTKNDWDAIKFLLCHAVSIIVDDVHGNRFAIDPKAMTEWADQAVMIETKNE